MPSKICSAILEDIDMFMFIFLPVTLSQWCCSNRHSQGWLGVALLQTNILSNCVQEQRDWWRAILSLPLQHWKWWNWHVQDKSPSVCNTPNSLLTCLILPGHAFLTTASRDAANRHGEYCTWAPTEASYNEPQAIEQHTFKLAGVSSWLARVSF